MNKTQSREHWRELLLDSAQRWQILSVLTCLALLTPIPFCLVLPLWGVHDWLMARESSSRTVKCVAYGVLAVLSALFLYDVFLLISTFL